MKTQDLLLIGLGGAILLWIAAQTDTGEEFVNDVVDYGGDTYGDIMSSVRGIRNNNPGNIEKSSVHWQGLSDSQTDPRFFQFRSMEYGVRAIVKILRTYSGRGVNTISRIVSTWAPSVENDTTAYINSVSGDTGIPPDVFVDVRDPETVFAIVRAIIKHENGSVAALLISDDVVRSGISMANV